MKRNIVIMRCDLCGHESDPQRPNSVRKMHTLKFSSTDQAGHDEDWTKEVCQKCREKIQSLPTST